MRKGLGIQKRGEPDLVAQTISLVAYHLASRLPRFCDGKLNWNESLSDAHSLARYRQPDQLAKG